MQSLRLSPGKIPCCEVQPKLMAIWSKGLQIGKWAILFLYLLIAIDDQCGLKAKNVSNKQMTNEVGRSLFSKAGELGVPLGIMTMKVKDAFLSKMYLQLL
jgi:hypothetical protein